MQTAIETFRENIRRVRHLAVIHTTITANITSDLDLSDILRMEIVLAVSALDHYVHDVTRLGMLEAFQGQRPRTPAFLRFSISIENILDGLVNPNDTNWFEDEVKGKHSYQSFQRADKIADAIRLIDQARLWQDVATSLGLTASEVKEELDLIVDRRNKIAHEADINPSYPEQRWPISVDEADVAVDFIERVAETIHIIITR